MRLVVYLSLQEESKEHFEPMRLAELVEEMCKRKLRSVAQLSLVTGMTNRKQGHKVNSRARSVTCRAVYYVFHDD